MIALWLSEERHERVLKEGPRIGAGGFLFADVGCINLKVRWRWFQ